MEIPFGAAAAQESRRGRPNGFFRAVKRPYAAVPIIAGFVSFLKPEIPFFSHWGAGLHQTAGARIGRHDASARSAEAAYTAPSNPVDFGAPSLHNGRFRNSLLS